LPVSTALGVLGLLLLGASVGYGLGGPSWSAGTVGALALIAGVALDVLEGGGE